MFTSPQPENLSPNLAALNKQTTDNSGGRRFSKGLGKGPTSPLALYTSTLMELFLTHDPASPAKADRRGLRPAPAVGPAAGLISGLISGPFTALVALIAVILGCPTAPPWTASQAIAAEADGNVRAQHGDWQVVCKPPPPGASKEVCAVVQSVTAEDRNNVGLTVYFQNFANGTQVLRVFAPIGVLLPPGLGLKIDGKDVGNAPFLRCHTFACYAQVTVKAELVQQLQTGKQAIFIIFQTEEAGIGIPISLSGFKEALADLQK